MIILIFLYSTWRLSLLSLPLPLPQWLIPEPWKSMAMSRVSFCGTEMLPWNTASEQGQMAVNENKRLYVGCEFCLAMRKRCLTIWRVRLEQPSGRNNWNLRKKKKSERWIDFFFFKWEAEIFEVVTRSVAGPMRLLMVSLLQHQPPPAFQPVACWSTAASHPYSHPFAVSLQRLYWKTEFWVTTSMVEFDTCM